MSEVIKKSPTKNKKKLTLKNSTVNTTKNSNDKAKKRRRGFTLIELLATITIIGILFLIAIPAVSSTIDNSRKSAFADVALKYIHAIKQSVTQDEIVCGPSSISINSLPSDSSYYIAFDSSNDSGKDLMEKGGKSPYGNGDVKGVVVVSKDSSGDKYAIAIVDEQGRGFGNFQGFDYTIHSFVSEANLKKENVMEKTVYGKYYYDDFDDHLDNQFPSGYFCIDQKFRCGEEFRIKGYEYRCKLR